MSMSSIQVVRVDLPQGKLVITAEYYQGYRGSYLTPPEPDEIQILSMGYASGEALNLSEDEREEFIVEHYDIILEAVAKAHEEYLEELYSKFPEKDHSDLDPEIPF